MSQMGNADNKNSIAPFPTASEQAPASGRQDENLRPSAPAGIKREDEASPLHETRDETPRRDENDVTQDGTRRAIR